MCNKEIRDRAKQANVKLWQIADELRMNDYNLSRKLRHELPEEKKAEILTIIERLAKAQ